MGPDVVSRQPNITSIEVAREELQCLCHLDRSDDMSDRSHNSGSLTGRRRSWRRQIAKQTSQAWCCSRDHRHNQAVTSYSRRVDPRLMLLGTRVVQYETCFEVVQCIENQIDIAQKVFDVGWIDILDEGLDLNRRVDFSQL